MPGALPPEVAQELAQEVFMRVWRGWETYDPRAGSLPTWIWVIARNVRIDHYRARDPEPDELGDPPDDTEPGRIAQARTSAWLRSEFVGLTDPQRLVLELRLLEHLTYEQISQRTALSISAIKGLMFRAKLALTEREAKGPDADPDSLDPGR